MIWQNNLSDKLVTKIVNLVIYQDFSLSSWVVFSDEIMIEKKINKA